MVHGVEFITFQPNPGPEKKKMRFNFFDLPHGKNLVCTFLTRCMNETLFYWLL